MKRSDDFTPATKQTIAKRAGHMCAYPDCLATTSGPAKNTRKSVNIGEACHITAAQSNGPRYDESLSPEQRRDAENGIWMCRTHAALIDRDEERFTSEILKRWKYAAEDRAQRQLGRPQGCATGKLASVSPATRLGAEQTAFIGDQYFPFTYIFDPDHDYTNLTWFVSAMVIQFSIQKNPHLKNAVLEHLIVTVNETKPIPKYQPLMGVYPAESNMFYVEIGPNRGTTPREFRPTRYYYQASQDTPERLAFPPALVLDNDTPTQVALRLNAELPAMYLVSVDASVSAGSQREILPIMPPQWMIFEKPDDDHDLEYEVRTSVGQ